MSVLNPERSGGGRRVQLNWRVQFTSCMEICLNHENLFHENHDNPRKFNTTKISLGWLTSLPFLIRRRGEVAIRI